MPEPTEPRCTCPAECDCQDPEHGMVSNECPEHNWRHGVPDPMPSPDCPVHGAAVPEPTEPTAKSFDAMWDAADRVLMPDEELTVTVRKAALVADALIREALADAEERPRA